jgi:hypothetical protein
MANIFIAWQNRVDDGTVSGGSWLSSNPLTNVQNRQVQKVARSTNAANSSTKFDLDLLTQQTIGVFALVVHNISSTGKIRISASNDSTAYNNIVADPNNIAATSWTKVGIDPLPNATVAPDGTTTAAIVREDAFNGQHFAQQSLGTFSGARFVEGWIKAAGRTKGELQIVGVGGTAAITFDLAAKTITSSSGAAMMTEHADGWFKITSSANFTSASISIQFQIFDDAGNASYTGNGSSGFATWGFRSAGGSGLAADSGWVDVWPSGVIPTDLLEWEDDNFWLGTISAQARAGFQSPFIWRLPSLALARYWRCEIFDSSNSDGYVQIGRVFLARGWTPSVNFSYGGGLGYQDPTPVLTSLSGAEYFDVRSKFRVMTFELQYISDSEAYNYALELQRLAGVSGEVLVMPDGGSDAGTQPLRSFVGRIRQAGAVVQTKPTAYTVNFEIKELL